MELSVNRHVRYNRSPKGLARYKRHNAKRISVMGERVYAPDMETQELMRQLRDDRKAAHG
jgi:hypothetical protein